MPTTAPLFPRFFPRLSPTQQRRAIGLTTSLFIQLLFLALLFSLASEQVQEKVVAIVSFNVPNAPEAKDAPAPSPAPKSAPTPAPAAKPQNPDPTPIERPIEIPLIPPQPSEMPPAAPQPAPPTPDKRPDNRPVMGPPAPRPGSANSTVGDTPLVDGKAPNGQPLYAAAWQREPYPEELRGFLATAEGPGWGRISCRTAPNYRVEDCVITGEYPTGSGYGRAVLAASWQFKVRPPRKGGREMVGEWVQIRICELPNGRTSQQC